MDTLNEYHITKQTKSLAVSKSASKVTEKPSVRITKVTAPSSTKQRSGKSGDTKISVNITKAQNKTPTGPSTQNIPHPGVAKSATTIKAQSKQKVK
ncbi:unnamed protein product, partial [Didymodactylos carnosus]